MPRWYRMPMRIRVSLDYDELKYLARRLAIPFKKFPAIITEIIPNGEQQKEFYETVQMLVDTYMSQSNRLIKYVIIGSTIAVIAVIGVLAYLKKI